MYTLKKSLGQHFLKDENICKKIVAAIQEYPHQKLLEVGPGGGALTKYLLEIPALILKRWNWMKKKWIIYLTLIRI